MTTGNTKTIFFIHNIDYIAHNLSAGPREKPRFIAINVGMRGECVVKHIAYTLI